MALESATYISGLVNTNPSGSDSISQGDDHLRLIKSVLKNTLPNADEAINGIHTGTTAPSPTTTGLVWFDTSNNLIKIRNEADSGWITLMASEGSRVLSVTHSEQATSSTIRSDTYTAVGWSVAHTCLSASSNLYVRIEGMNDIFSSWDDGSDHQKTFIRLTNSSGTIITGTTDDVFVGDIKDAVGSGLSSNEYGFGLSHTWKVTPANRPDTASAVGSNTFKLYTKTPNSGGGGTVFCTGNWMVWEVEE